MERNVLIIAYHFPPRGGIAVKRTVRFVKTLPLYGWRPVVLSVKLNLSDYKILDASALDELPEDLRVYRTQYFKKRRPFGRRHGEPPGARDMAAIQEKISKKTFIDIEESLLKNIFMSACGAASYLWPFIPDIERGWVPIAAAHGREIIRREKIDAIYTTSPPHSTHLIGCALSKDAGIPWVADFRDDWVNNPLFRPSDPISAKIHRALEGKVVRSATRVVVTNGQTKESFLAKHPFSSEEKIVVIPNGYDPADFAGIERKPFSKFTVINNGGLGPGLSARHFLSALRSLIDEHPELRDEMRVLLVGGGDPEGTKAIDELDLKDVVTVQGYIPYKDCLKQLVRAHLFLLFLTDEAGGSGRTPAKLYEYLAAGRPVLGMVVEGDAADKIRNMKLGSVVSPTDVDGIKKELYSYYQRYKANRDEYLEDVASPEDMARYDQNTLTKRLAELLSGDNEK